MPAARSRPWLAALIIALAAQLLFTINLTRPTKLVFDETHYVPAARTLLALERPANTEHPLLGKTIIAGGIALFGDNATGWRALSTIAGTATVLGLFACLMLLFGNVRTASLGAVFAMLNQTLFIQARIGMLDVFMGAFVVLGLAALLWAMRAGGHGRIALAGALLGLATGVKWAAAPYLAFAGVALLATRLAHARAGPTAPSHWPGASMIAAVLTLGLASLAAYFVTFWPAFFYAEQPLTLARLLPFQFAMYAEQTQALAPHTYQSQWWSWPLMLRPIWYLYEPVDGAVRGILLVGNPVIHWGGLIAVAACLIAGVRQRDGRLLAIAGFWLASWGIWIVIPKSLGFFYYYYLPGLFLCLALAAALTRIGRRTSYLPEYFAGIALVAFGYFYPIISAAALPGDQAFLKWMWLPGWP